MNCSNCGAQLIGNENFCAQCGNPTQKQGRANDKVENDLTFYKEHNFSSTGNVSIFYIDGIVLTYQRNTAQRLKIKTYNGPYWQQDIHLDQDINWNAYIMTQSKNEVLFTSRKDMSIREGSSIRLYYLAHTGASGEINTMHPFFYLNKDTGISDLIYYPVHIIGYPTAMLSSSLQKLSSAASIAIGVFFMMVNNSMGLLFILAPFAYFAQKFVRIKREISMRNKLVEDFKKEIARA